MGFGHGAAGTGGTFFQLLVIVFMEFLGVSLGQMIGAISPTMQVRLVSMSAVDASAKYGLCRSPPSSIPSLSLF